MKLHNYESLVSCNYACMFSPFSDRNLGVDSNLIVHFMYQKIQCIYFLSDYIFSKCFSFTKIILPICLLLFLKRRIIPSKHFSHYLNPLPLVKITKFKKKTLLKTLAFFPPIAFWCSCLDLSDERYSVFISSTDIIYPLPNSYAFSGRNLIHKWDKSLVFYICKDSCK